MDSSTSSCNQISQTRDGLNRCLGFSLILRCILDSTLTLPFAPYIVSQKGDLGRLELNVHGMYQKTRGKSSRRPDVPVADAQPLWINLRRRFRP